MVPEINIGSRDALARGARTALVLAAIGLLAGPAPAQVTQRESTEKPLFETPRLAIPEREIDFGEVVRGETLEATFVLQNIGAQPLKVLKAEPG